MALSPGNDEGSYTPTDSPDLENRAPGWSVVAILTAGALLFAWSRAWVCDDAFITFRHVTNCLAGHGAVFNVGERVQGYSHPLWFLLLLATGFAGPPHIIAIVLGLLLTGALPLCLAVAFRRTCSPLLLLLTAFVLIFGSSTLVQYQVSGLEGPLTHLLLIILCSVLLFRPLSSRTLIAGVLLVSLLIVDRPDHAILCCPILVWLFAQAWRRRALWRAAAALTPAIAWYAFAMIYYGTPVPNTAYAKVAFPLPVAAAKGASYLLDYIRWEPAHALLVVLAATAGFAVSLRRTLRREGGAGAEACLCAGLILHLMYVVFTAGDFMRGRVLLPAVVLAVMLACRWLVRVQSRHSILPGALVAAILTILAEFFTGMVDSGTLVSVAAGVRAAGDQLLYRPLIAIPVLAAIVAFLFLATNRATGGSRPRAGLAIFLGLLVAQATLILGLAGQFNPGWDRVALALASAGGAAIIATLLLVRSPLAAGTASILVVAVTGVRATVDLAPLDDSISRESGIADEYTVYRDSRNWLQFPSPLRYINGSVREGLAVGVLAGRYARDVGPITVNWNTLGLFAHFAGPGVHTIDAHGLVDAFVARCPGDARSRTGHVRHRIPPGYLESRGAVNLLPDWERRLAALDPSLRTDAEAMRADAQWLEANELARWKATQTVIAGKLFSGERLRLIPAYVLPRHQSPPSRPS